jgi:Eukaryotic membrane protein family
LHDKTNCVSGDQPGVMNIQSADSNRLEAPRLSPNVHRVEDDASNEAPVTVGLQCDIIADGVISATTALELRVEELETKLSVLSRLLQTQQASQRLLGVVHATPSRQLSPPPPPPLPENFLSTGRVVPSNIPYLESPAPMTAGRKTASYDSEDDSVGDVLTLEEREDSEVTVVTGNGSNRLDATKRNLSFRLLYGGDENEYKNRNESAPPTSSMTPAERRWLRPMIMQFQEEQREEKAKSSNVPDDSVRSKWLNYLNSFQESTPDVDEQMEEFIKVPVQMESIMGFGFFICMDSFLYMITILPIRFVWSCFLLVLRLILWRRPPSPSFQFHRQHTYQLIQVTILFFIYRYVLARISIGKMYHWIRGQAMIKLYVLIAMVEVFDRLFCGLGQDCLDSMYWNTVSRPKSSRMIVSIALVLMYATCHALILFVHVETLNVAMNSADQALLTLLISGNFAEIKSTVFKKYNRPALFKITATDICERFKLGLFLGLVLLLNVCQGMERGQLADYFRICGIVWCAELVADAIKHAFITKFNFLPSKVYREYALLLAGDVTGIGHEGFNLDHSHAVVKRIGFAQIPLVCVMFRLLREAVKYASLNDFWKYWSPVGLWGVGIGFWLALVGIKLSLGGLLQRISLRKLRSAPEVSHTPSKGKKMA